MSFDTNVTKLQFILNFMGTEKYWHKNCHTLNKYLIQLLFNKT